MTERPWSSPGYGAEVAAIELGMLETAREATA